MVVLRICRGSPRCRSNGARPSGSSRDNFLGNVGNGNASSYPWVAVWAWGPAVGGPPRTTSCPEPPKLPPRAQEDRAIPNTCRMSGSTPTRPPLPPTRTTTSITTSTTPPATPATPATPTTPSAPATPTTSTTPTSPDSYSDYVPKLQMRLQQVLRVPTTAAST